MLRDKFKEYYSSFRDFLKDYGEFRDKGELEDEIFEKNGLVKKINQMALSFGNNFPVLRNVKASLGYGLGDLVTENFWFSDYRRYKKT